MSETLSVRERIERLLVTKVAAITGVLDVHRFEGEPVDPVPFHAIIEVERESADEGPKSNVGVTAKELAVNVYFCLNKPDNESETSATVANRWAARIEEAILADPELTEAGNAGERLAFDSRHVVTSTTPLTAGAAMFSICLEFVIQFRHPRNNPYAIGA